MSITICTSKNCPERYNCYRYKSKLDKNSNMWNFEYTCNENNGFEYYIKADKND